MRRLTAMHWLVIGAAAVCTVLLGFVSTTPPGPKAPVVAQHEGHGHSLDEQLDSARKRLTADATARLHAIERAIATNRDHNQRKLLYDSLGRFAAMAGEPVLAAWYAEQRAQKDNGSSADWQFAGENYRKAVFFTRDEGNHDALFDAALRCFNKAVELDPENLDAKVGLGMCYVQHSQDPMKGIGMLLEVVEEDSTNLNAHLALGDFSVQRNAPDKAIMRYSTALKLRPDLSALHLSLGDLYKQVGDSANAVYHFEAYLEKESVEPELKIKLENEISKLRINQPKPAGNR